MPGLPTLPEFHDREAFAVRLLNPEHVHERFTFVVGSAVTAPPRPGEKGVPTARDIVERIRRKFDRTEQGRVLERELSAQVGGNQYQVAIHYLVQIGGQTAVDELITDAVHETVHEHITVPRYALSPERELLVPTEEVVDAWYIPPAVKSLGALIATNGVVFGRDVLTTNFDPLLEVSIQLAGGSYVRFGVDQDGDIGALWGNATRVIHLHGFYLWTDTLHTPDQLVAERPRLRASLEWLFARRTVVVVGYGGWDDVFMRTLGSLAEALDVDVRIMWAFYDEDEQRIVDGHGHVLEALRWAIERGSAQLYKGIDVHEVLPEVEQGLRHKETLLRFALRMVIYEAFGLFPEEVRRWDDFISSGAMSDWDWRNAIEREFDATAEDLSLSYRSYLESFADADLEDAVDGVMVHFLREKYGDPLPVLYRDRLLGSAYLRPHTRWSRAPA